jgi:catechol 2,3-dioxygenase-like lactoylglutathione lyase family enzyme
MTEPALHAVSPIFQVSNLQRGIDFYTRVMGFELEWTWGSPPDRASLCRDAIEITLEVERSPRTSHIYVQVRGVADRIYGMRDGRIADPDGNYIALGEAIPGAG